MKIAEIRRVIESLNWNRLDLGGATRDDVRTHARLALGAPLSAFTARGATGDVRERVTLEGALNYSSRESSSPLSDYDGWGAELRLIWRFGARD